MVIIQIKDDSYNTIVDLYNAVAVYLGYDDVGNLQYDCTKIEVSRHIQDQIFDYYENVKGVDKSEAGMYWVCYGPKANEELREYDVVIEDGFIVEEC